MLSNQSDKVRKSPQLLSSYVRSLFNRKFVSNGIVCGFILSEKISICKWILWWTFLFASKIIPRIYFFEKTTIIRPINDILHEMINYNRTNVAFAWDSKRLPAQVMAIKCKHIPLKTNSVKISVIQCGSVALVPGRMNGRTVQNFGGRIEMWLKLLRWTGIGK